MYSHSLDRFRWLALVALVAFSFGTHSAFSQDDEQAELPLNGDLKFVSQDCEAAFGRGALLDLPRVLLGRAVRLASGAIGQALDYDQTNSVVDGLASKPNGSVSSLACLIVPT